MISLILTYDLSANYFEVRLAAALA